MRAIVASAGIVTVKRHTPFEAVPENGLTTRRSTCPSLGPPESKNIVNTTHWIGVGFEVNGIEKVTTDPGHQFQDEIVNGPGTGRVAGSPVR